MYLFGCTKCDLLHMDSPFHHGGMQALKCDLRDTVPCPGMEPTPCTESPKS